MPDDLPSPWIEFLTELDQMLEASLELHCIGGFILLYFSGLPRSTGDIDYYSAVPAHVDLPEIAGEASTLHKKNKVALSNVDVASLPDTFVSALTDMLTGH